MNDFDPAAIPPAAARCAHCAQEASLMPGTPEFERALLQEPFVYVCPACKQQVQHEALLSRYTNLQ